MHKFTCQTPPNIASSLQRAFLQPQSTLVLHSRGLDILPALAQSLYLQHKSHVTLLIDFTPKQIQQLNYHLHEIKAQHIIAKTDIRTDKPQILNLNKTVRQKRKKCYLIGGIFALTTQIMLLDLLSQCDDLPTQLITRVVVKDADMHVQDMYGLRAWICTLLNLNNNGNTVITGVSSNVKQFKGDHLERIMRLLYCNKLILWPFGRSQIHKSLTYKSLTNRSHKLPLNPSQQHLHELYCTLLNYVNKSTNNNNNQNNKNQIQYLLNCLLNCSKLDYLVRLEDVINNCSQYSIWKCNNANIIETVDSILHVSRNCVYSLLLISHHHNNNKYNNYSQPQYHNQQQVNHENHNDNINHNKEQQYISASQIPHQPHNQQINAHKLRQIDLNTLLPTQAVLLSDPIQSKPVLYQLHYQLHVNGITTEHNTHDSNNNSNNNRENSPLLSVKLLQIIKQLHRNWNNIIHKCQNNKQSVQMNMQQQQIQMMMPSQHNRQSQSNDKININTGDANNIRKQQLSQIQIQKLQQQYQTHNISNTQNNQQQHDKQQQKHQEEARKQQNRNDLQINSSSDFSIYQFNPKSSIAAKTDNIGQLKQQKIKQVSPLKQNKQQKVLKQQHKQQKPYPQSVNSLKIFNQCFHIPHPQPLRQILLCTSSPQLNKSLHFALFCYQHNLHYMGYLRKLCLYLQYKQQQRVTTIKKIIKRINNGSKNNNNNFNRKINIIQHQAVLLQELYIQLKQVDRLVQICGKMRDDVEQRDLLFTKQLARVHLRYADIRQIKLWNRDYSPLDQCSITVYSQDMHYQCKYHISIQSITQIPQLNQYLRFLAPQLVFLYSPNTTYVRHLNISHSQDTLAGVQQLHMLYFANSIQNQKVVKVVKEEDQAFWEIGKNRNQLAQYKENAHVRIKQLIIDDQIHKKAKMITLAAQTQAKFTKNQASQISRTFQFKVQRTILIDKRQFKSLLPSYLFHHGFKIIPIFLENADYILSNQVAIQKKSVHTRDLHESLKSGRLAQQVKRLCSKFSKPYILIQCPDLTYFKKQEFSFGYSKASGDKYSFNVRKQLIQLMNKHPKINIIWSTSYMDTVKYIIELKKNREQPDINKFKPKAEENQMEMLEQDSVAVPPENNGDQAQ